MKGAAAAVVYWALVHGIAACVLLGWTSDALQLWLLGGSAAVAVLVGLAILAYREPSTRRVPELSPPMILLAAGIAGVVSGVAFGRWLLFVGAGVTALALAGLARELAAERHA